MAQLQGVIVCATVEKLDVYQWTDPATGQVKPIRSIKVLLAHGDGTVTRESISIPSQLRDPPLEEGKAYAMPCTVALNKKRQQVAYTLRTDIPPFPAPQIG